MAKSSRKLFIGLDESENDKEKRVVKPQMASDTVIGSGLCNWIFRGSFS
jgi:hypothetical protein